MTTTVDEPEELMTMLCEALCTVIHAAHLADVKDDYESVQFCRQYIEKGFADASFKICMNIAEEPNGHDHQT